MCVVKRWQVFDTFRREPGTAARIGDVSLLPFNNSISAVLFVFQGLIEDADILADLVHLQE